MESKENLIQLLKKYGQENLLRFYDELDNDEKNALSQDIKSVDFDLIKSLAETSGKPCEKAQNLGDISPIDYIVSPSFGSKEFKEYREAGIEAIKNGEVIAITMAGGQGTRLGHDGPKGTFDMGLASHKSLFEIQIDMLKELAAETGTFVHWYIMTSEINNDASVEFFEQNDYFGYPKDKVSFFPQHMIPVLSKDGKMMLESKSKILRSPDGNGGVFSALKSKGIIKNEKANGAKYVFVCGIDNCLVKMCDPLFVGCIAKTGKSCLTKTFMKRSADEKAGVYCMRNGKPCVIEYTEVPQELAEMKNADGSFTYGDANVLNYIFKIDVIEQAIEKGLPYHTAIKKVTRLDDNGNTVTSEKPDSCKFEMFMFDIFDYIDNVSAFRIRRECEFAPIKNKEGEDSPQTARNLYMREHKIIMENPIVEMDGDEMTRVIWEKIKNKIIYPFVDLNTEYYDLSVMNRDATDDQVTIASALATKVHKVAVKCATITPNAARVEEYGLKKMWKSPNGTIRGILDGTVFRSPIIVKGIEPLVKNWEKPIVIARHAYGDLYSAVEGVVPEGGTATLIIKDKDGNVTEKVIHEFKKSDGIVMGMHNEESSIKNFARACFSYSLSEGLPLWFSSKDTISKVYDHRFKEIFQEIYDNEYKTAFEEKGISYFYTLVDDAISRVMQSKGGFIWACKNYDGDVFSDMLASSFGSLSMMTSVLVSPDGYYEYEAAHGTIPRHYHKYLNGEPTSTNPTATLFAWTGALAKRAELDENKELYDFAKRVEKATINTIESGKMTGDLAKITTIENPVTMDLDGFLDEIAGSIYN